MVVCFQLITKRSSRYKCYIIRKKKRERKTKRTGFSSCIMCFHHSAPLLLHVVIANSIIFFINDSSFHQNILE